MIDRLARRFGVPESAIPAVGIALIAAAVIVGVTASVALAMRFLANY